MSWQDILKRVDIRNAEEYERASLDDRKAWHIRQADAYRTRLKALQQTHNVTNEESPMYKEMVELQELFRFHVRQRGRIKGMVDKEDFYSLELETNRRKHKGQITPQGNPMPYTELSEEVYETLSDSEKRTYHKGMRQKTDGEEEKFHGRMESRLRNIHNREQRLPTFASSKHGGKSMMGIVITREEYENMSNEDKRKYHARMHMRAKRGGDKDLETFHGRQKFRLRRNSNLPTYFSLEEQNSKEDVNSENLERMAGAVTTTAPAHAKLFKPAYRTRKKRKDE